MKTKTMLADKIQPYYPGMAQQLRDRAKTWAKTEQARNICDRASYIVADLLAYDFGKLFGDVVRKRCSIEEVRAIYQAMQEQGFLSSRDVQIIDARLNESA